MSFYSFSSTTQRVFDEELEMKMLVSRLGKVTLVVFVRWCLQSPGQAQGPGWERARVRVLGWRVKA